jgi:salicylate hydroxylase
VASSRNVLIAGAGIGGLSAALMLVQSGFRITLLEQAERLEETGAGIQLSPNATRILIDLGLGPRLKTDVFVPEAIAIKTATGGTLARIPLGAEAEERYGAPYWSIHRADLQSALLEAVQGNPDISLRLGTRVEDFVVHQHGVSVACSSRGRATDQQGIALVGADGLWSALRPRLSHRARPQFARRTAWRALVPASTLDAEFRAPEVQVWLGRNAHIVHYPVKTGALINIVAIVDDGWSEQGWTASGDRDELLAHYSPWRWCAPVREFLEKPDRWLKWALYDVPPLGTWSEGPVTLLGDAAHPMLPFLAQGAAMAIEDAAVLAGCMGRYPDDIASAMRRYERARRRRTARVQNAARSNGRTYHMSAAEAVLRNTFLRLAGGKALRRRYNWLYDWKTAPPGSAARRDVLPSARDDDET